MDSFPDINALTDQQLKDLIKELGQEELRISSNRELLHAKTEELKAEEAAVSHARRVAHGRIDIARAELVNRRRKRDQGGEGGGGSGVREPRRPTPQPDAGGISLPAPGAADDNPAQPPPLRSDH